MNIPVLISGTVLIIIFSWFLSIKHKRYHGVARFFSFESIFILVMLNWRFWFDEPFSPGQIVSWILLFSSIYFAVAGFLQLRGTGKPEGGNFENTSVLVKKGLYRFIRHPLYLSLFILGTGIVLKRPGTVTILIGVVNLVAVYITARIEEKEMIAKFGDDYRQYMTETKMFMPFCV